MSLPPHMTGEAFAAFKAASQARRRAYEAERRAYRLLVPIIPVTGAADSTRIKT